MRTAYQASPWRAATTPLARTLSFAAPAPERLGDPSAFFSKAPFIPARPVGAPPMGGMNRTLILVDERRVPAPAYDPLALELDESLTEGVDITRPVCRCKFGRGDAELGQGCSSPTAGGSGEAAFGAGDGGSSGDSNVGTIALAGVAGIGLLALLGII